MQVVSMRRSIGDRVMSTCKKLAAKLEPPPEMRDLRPKAQSKAEGTLCPIVEVAKDFIGFAITDYVHGSTVAAKLQRDRLCKWP